MNNATTTFNHFLKTIGRKSIGSEATPPVDLMERLNSIENKLGIEHIEKSEEVNDE